MSKNEARSGKDLLLRLAQTEWDFSLVPTEELVACLVWEYLREVREDPLMSWRYRALIIAWTYDSRDERKRFNARFHNGPKDLIAHVTTAKDNRFPPWQELDQKTRQSFASSGQRRTPLIALQLVRQGLWDWTYTFRPESKSLELGDLFSGIHDWLSALDEKTRSQLENESQQILLSMLPSAVQYKHDIDEKPGVRPEPFDVREMIAATKPPQPGIPADLVAARLGNFVSQPDFLINWQEYDKRAIKQAFAKWLDKNKPKHLKPCVQNSEARAASLRKDLKSLGLCGSCMSTLCRSL